MIPVGSNERLALFLPTLDDGGAERVMLQLAASFSARGQSVDLVVAIPGGPLDGQVPPGPRVVSLDASRTILALPALADPLSGMDPAFRPIVVLVGLSPIEEDEVRRGLGLDPDPVAARE